MPDISELLKRLKSDSPEERAAAVERAAVTVERLIHAVVSSLESAGRHHHYLFDHVHRFGPSMVEPLEALLERSQDRDTSVLCALLLARLQSRAGVPVLLEVLEGESEAGDESDQNSWALQAATRLGETGVKEAVPLVVHRLRTISLSRAAEIVGLLQALALLDSTLPADLATRFSTPDAPAEARAIAERTLRQGAGGQVVRS